LEQRTDSAKVEAKSDLALAATLAAVASSKAAPQAASVAGRKAEPEETSSKALPASQAPGKENGKSAVALPQAAVESGKAAAQATTNASSKAVPEATSSKALPEAVTDKGQHVIPAALIGPAGGQAFMTHDAEMRMIDKVAVGSLDFVATGAHKEYCKGWLRDHGYLCEFSSILLSLLICTPLVALSVAACFGIVSGLKSVNN
jgi:hypothetical protein